LKSAARIWWLVWDPVEDRVEVDHVEAVVGERREIERIADEVRNVCPRALLGQLDAQRERVEAGHRATRAHHRADVVRQQTRAAAHVERALAGRDVQLLNQRLAREVLAVGADLLVALRELWGIEA
jgi:hypothetical protein